MAKTVLSFRTGVPYSFFNAVNNPVFNKDPGQELFDGENYRLEDDALSNASTAIKNRVNSYLNRFLVTKPPGGGLFVNVSGGIIRKPNGDPRIQNDIQIAVADNTTNYIYADKDGIIRSSTLKNTVWEPLALVQTSGGQIVDPIIDYRATPILPRSDIIKIFGGNGEQGDFTVIAGQTITLRDGYYSFKDLVVQQGGVLIIEGVARILCSGNFINDGQIRVTGYASGGATILVSAGSGGGGTNGFGLGGGSGSSNAGSEPYNFYGFPFGSGGSSGFAVGAGGSGNGSIFPGNGGKGGGGLLVEVAGAIEIRGSVIAAGEPGGNAASQGTIIGSASGGGAGSGGLLFLSSLLRIVLYPTSTINLSGGRGGNAFNSQTGGSSQGGSGGSGGWFGAFSPSTSLQGNINLSGGLMGTSTGPNPSNLGGGSGGGFGGRGGRQSAGESGRQMIRTFPLSIG